MKPTGLLHLSSLSIYGSAEHQLSCPSKQAARPTHLYTCCLHCNHTIQNSLTLRVPGWCPPTSRELGLGISCFSFDCSLWPFQSGVTQALGQFEFIHQAWAQNWVGQLASCFCLHIWFYHLPEWRGLHQYSSQENTELLQLTCSKTHLPNLFSFKLLQLSQRTQWKQYFPTGMNRLQHFSELQINLFLVND